MKDKHKKEQAKQKEYKWNIKQNKEFYEEEKNWKKSMIGEDSKLKNYDKTNRDNENYLKKKCFF